MNNTGKLTVSCLKICVTLTIALWSNPLQAGEAQKRADSLFNKGEFRKAALLYEKVIYNQADSVNLTVILLKKSRCYKQLRQFEQAKATLARIEYPEIPDSLALTIARESILMPYLANEGSEAYSAYKEAEINLDSNQLQRLDYLKVLVLMEQQKWKQAEKAFRDYAKRKGANLNTDSLFQTVTADNAFKNKGTAKLLSSILPGAGQIHAGKFFQGLASLALTTGAAYLGVNRFLHKYYLATSISGIGLFLRFYFGGVRHTVDLVEKANRQKGEKFRDLISRIVLDLKESSKNGK